MNRAERVVPDTDLYFIDKSYTGASFEMCKLY